MGASPLIHWGKQSSLLEPEDGGEAKQWQTIMTLNSDNRNVRIGMWSHDNEVCFCLEDLLPENFIDSDTWEFSVRIKDLKRIITEAQRIAATYQEETKCPNKP